MQGSQQTQVTDCGKTVVTRWKFNGRTSGTSPSLSGYLVDPVCFVTWLVSFNQKTTDQTNQIDQMNQTDRRTFSAPW